MVEELPSEIEIGVIKLEPGIPFMYTGWGIKYRYKGGDWRIAEDMAFRRKSDAENWMNEKILRYEGMEGEVVPVKRTLLMDEKGIIERQIEELS